MPPFNIFQGLRWDRRITAIAMYVLLPALFGTITRIAGWNPMLGDFFGIDLRDGMIPAFLILTLYVLGCILFFLLVARIAPRTKGTFEINASRVEKLGVFVLAYQAASLVFTLQSGLGIAASTESVDGNSKIVFILLSSDYIFFIFFLLARERSKLVWLNSILYLVYSILRGWASGMLLLLVLSYVKRPRRIKARRIFVGIGILFLAVPILMGAREFFRGGDTQEAGIVETVSLASESIHYEDVLFLLVNRFDLVPPTQTFGVYYKNLLVGLNADTVCYPWNEGIYQTIINTFLKNPKCVAAGEALPSIIHGQFFFDRRTSFSVGAGWLYGADLLTAVSYTLYIALLIIWARMLAGPLVRIPAMRGFCVFLIVFYVVPGWYFHYIQAINAVLFANLFLRVTWLKKPEHAGVEQVAHGHAPI